MRTPKNNPEGIGPTGERLAKFVSTCPTCGAESSVRTAEVPCDNPYCESHDFVSKEEKL